MGTRAVNKHDMLMEIVGRCTGPAWELVRQFCDDPLFHQLIEELKHVDGAITGPHVEAAYAALIQYGPRSFTRPEQQNCH